MFIEWVNNYITHVLGYSYVAILYGSVTYIRDQI